MGSFYDSITMKTTQSGMMIFSDGFVDGNSIVRKYGDNILSMGAIAREYFILNNLRPWLERFFLQCGYK